MRESEAVGLGSKVKVGELAGEIMKGLEEYAMLATEEMKEAVMDAGKTVQKEIRNTAPANTGKYAKSWRVKKVNETSTALGVVVHSKGRYQLAHLLEFGHAQRRGGRVEAQPHLALAEAKGVKKLEADIENALKRLG